VDWYRKKRTEPLPYLADEDELNLADEINEQIFDNGDSPETEYLKSLIWTELYESLEQLPAEQKSVFELTEIKGLSFKEISDQTGLPVNTLISRKHYAVLFLRERLQLLYDELLNF
jgi:RNA polymerase sigma factor (sigma-70 family)